MNYARYALQVLCSPSKARVSVKLCSFFNHPSQNELINIQRYIIVKDTAIKPIFAHQYTESARAVVVYARFHTKFSSIVRNKSQEVQL